MRMLWREVILNQGGEPIYYHVPHRSWIIAGGPQITTNFMVKFHFYLTMRDGGSEYILP